MNKIYKLKFNRQTRQLDAVSELATSATTGSTQSATSLTSKLFKLGKLATLFIPFTALMSLAHADPARTGMQVVAGQVQTLTEGLVTTITNSPHAIINWEKFNINSNELVKFVQENANSAVLNRVLGGSVSQILGQLQSNGKVFIVNPAGIVFGANAQVDVAGLVASTLDLTNEDFVNGNYVFSQDKEQALASVINQGVIKVAEDGTLALVGGKVVNNGVLEAKNGTVYLLAGQSITIQDLDNPLISYKVTAENKAVNLGEIVAKKAYLAGNKVAHGYTQAQAFADLVSGSTSVSGVKVTATGEVVLYGATATDGSHSLAVVNAGVQAQKVDVFADVVVAEKATEIKATEQVRLGGDYQGQGEVKLAAKTTVQQGATIDVSATQGDAGTIIVWGNQAAVAGNFIATAVEGKGGFVETSGKVISVSGTQVDTRSVYGERGSWLIDPTEIRVVNSSTYSASEYLTILFDFASGTDFTSGVYTADQGTAKLYSFIKDDDLSSQLNTTNVTLLVKPDGDHKSVIYFDYATVKGDSSYGLSLVANELRVSNSTVSNLAYVNFVGTDNVTAENVTVFNSTFSSVGQVIFCVTENANITNSTLSLNGAAIVGGNLVLQNATIMLQNNTQGEHGDFYAYAVTGNNSITNGSIIIASGNATLMAKENLTIDGASSVTSTSFAAKGNDLTIKGASSVAGNSVNLEADNNISVTAQSSATAITEHLLVETANDITVDGKAKLEATKGNLNLRSTGRDVVVHNASVKAGQDLTLDGNRETLVVAASVEAGKGLAVVTGTGNALVQDSTLTASNDLTVVTSNTAQETKAGDLALANASLTATTGNVTVAVNNVALANTSVNAFAGDFNVSAKGFVAISAEEGKDNHLVAHNVNLHGAESVGVTYTDFTAINDLTVSSDNKVALNDGTSVKGTKVNLTAPEVHVINSSIAPSELNINTTKDLVLENNTLTAINYINLSGTNNAQLERNSFKTTVAGGGFNFNFSGYSLLADNNSYSSAGYFNAQAKDLVFNAGTNSSLSVTTDLNLTATNELDLSGFQVSANKVNLTGATVNVASSSFNVNGDLEAKATGEAGLNFTGTSVTNVANLTLTAEQGELKLDQAKVQHASKVVAKGKELTADNLEIDSVFTTPMSEATVTLEGTDSLVADNLNVGLATELKLKGKSLVLTNATTTTVANVSLEATEEAVLEDNTLTATNNLNVAAGVSVDSTNNSYTTRNHGGINFNLGENAELVSTEDKFNSAGNFNATAKNFVLQQGSTGSFSVTGSTNLNAERVELAQAKLTTSDANLTVGSLNASGVQVTITAGSLTVTANKAVTRLASLEDNAPQVAVPNHVNFTGATVTTTKGFVVSEADTLVLDKAKLDTGDKVALQAKNVTANDLYVHVFNITNFNASELAITGNESLTAKNLKVDLASNVALNGGTVTLENVTTQAVSNLTLNATKDLTVTDSTLKATNNLKVQAQTSVDSVNNTYTTTGAGEVNFALATTADLVSDGDTFNSAGDFTITAKSVSLVQDAGGSFTVSGTTKVDTENLELANSKLTTGTAELKVGSVNATKAELTTTTGDLSLTAEKEVTRLDSLEAEASTVATPNHVNFTGATLKAQGNLTLQGADTLVLTNANLTSQDDVSLQAKTLTATGLKATAAKGVAVKGGNVTLGDATLAVATSLDVEASDTLEVTNSTVTAPNVNLTATNDVEVDSSNFTGDNTGNFNVTSTQGKVVLTGNTIEQYKNLGVNAKTSASVVSNSLTLESLAFAVTEESEKPVTFASNNGTLEYIPTLNGVKEDKASVLEANPNLTINEEASATPTEEPTPVEPTPTEEPTPVTPTPTEPTPSEEPKEPTPVEEPAEPTPVEEPTEPTPVDPSEAGKQVAPIEVDQPQQEMDTRFNDLRLPDIFEDNRKSWLINNNFDVRRLDTSLGEFARTAQPLPEFNFPDLPTLEVTTTDVSLVTPVVDLVQEIANQLGLDTATQTVQTLLQRNDLTDEQRQRLVEATNN
ncbi:hypothetical protein CKF59_02755 [Psittacicella gerlachiana]|uniref:Filamentous haemagglutinin FhaB/tRNA nuclease CdiA-like TPS domain-containing protein n=2 Tax=Psittacicella gerlachiana TaxID=2028574 RepID=A0A3A1YDZ5_9GAMM|nr:hypothetical protein CKF59_02755 [Psittacicella gerlachiana]